jgi:hypothetical protein
MASTDNPRGLSAKQPSERLDYDFNLTNRLLDGDTIVSATVVCEDLSITLDGLDVDTHRVKQWLRGGVHAKTYKLTCAAVTDLGRELEEDMWVPVRER